MKIRIRTSPLNRGAFTLMELLVVISIIALLAAMTMGAFSYAQRAAMRNRTTAAHRAIISGLENYNSEWGEFPVAANDEESDDFPNKRQYHVSGARMLYQALSGDGTNEIKIGSGADASPSDGQWTEGEKMLLTDMPKDMYSHGSTNLYMLVDAFGHPFQYTKGGTQEAINPSYDLWSYGEDENNTSETGRSSKLDSTTSAKWIKNF